MLSQHSVSVPLPRWIEPLRAMTFTLLTRLRKANIPWLHHLLTLSTTLYIFPLQEAKTFLLVYAFLSYLLDAEAVLAALQDPSSPPLIPHPYLPFLGHVVGMFWHGARYFTIVNAKTQHPIFTLQTLVKKTVVVIDPAIATVIQKKSPHLTFYGMILEVTKRLVGLDEKTMEIVRWNLNGEHGPHEGLMNESEEMISGSLGPGPSLNALSTTQLEQFSILLNDFLPGPPAAGKGGQDVGLLEFVRKIFTQANAYTVYGPQNPFILHPHLVESFWTFEAGMIGLMADILPWLTSRRSWKARRDLNRALREFVEERHHANASPMIQKRVAINLKHGFTTTMAGRSELILLFGILGNAVPTTFWILANIYSRPDLLAALREETLRAVVTDEKGSVINMTALKSQCPLIVSTFRETLRQVSNLSSVRLVTGRYTVSAPGHPTYVLSEGSMIQIASGVIHVSQATWGADAAEFKPERWIGTDDDVPVEKEEKTALQLPKNVPSAAFRAFGGGSVLCPGRHFAMTEILGFVTLCLHMFDMTDARGGVLQLPGKDDRRIPLSNMKPYQDPRVRITRRAGANEDIRWRLEL